MVSGSVIPNHQKYALQRSGDVRQSLAISLQQFGVLPPHRKRLRRETEYIQKRFLVCLVDVSDYVVRVVARLATFDLTFRQFVPVVLDFLEESC